MLEYKIGMRNFSKAFTIVELLVVVVIIGILASITITSFSNIANRATIASIQADLTNAKKQLFLFKAQSPTDSFPTAINCPNPGATEICLKLSGSNAVQNYTGGSSVFILSINSGTAVYTISDSTNPVAAIDRDYCSSSGTVSYSGIYKIHTFTTTGTTNFVSGCNLNSVDYLIVAGGGAGGAGCQGGGGGAGGLLSGRFISLSSGTLPVVIGAGAVFSSTNTPNGGNSSFNGLTSLGGGRGTGEMSGCGFGGTNQADTIGGSGGGGSHPAPTPGAVGTSGQGNAGGTGISSTVYLGAGGGGAGSVGGDASATGPVGGVGGAGIQSSISGTAIYYAGGGGGAPRGYNGAAGGSGGGGAAGNNGMAGTSGTANTGGGGGAGNMNALGGNGGSGVVIIRYPRYQ